MHSQFERGLNSESSWLHTVQFALPSRAACTQFVFRQGCTDLMAHREDTGTWIVCTSEQMFLFSSLWPRGWTGCCSRTGLNCLLRPTKNKTKPGERFKRLTLQIQQIKCVIPPQPPRESVSLKWTGGVSKFIRSNLRKTGFHCAERHWDRLWWVKMPTFSLYFISLTL